MEPLIQVLPTDSFRLNFSQGVRAIHEDGNGNIWFGSHQEGLARFDGENFTYYTTSTGLCDNQIRSIFEDQFGNIWFEGGKGISSFQNGMLIKPENFDYSQKDKLQTQSGDLWFKGIPANGYSEVEGQPGAYRLEGNQLVFKAFPIEPGPGEEFYFSVSTPFVEGKDGQFWFGTYGAVFGIQNEDFLVLNDEYFGWSEENGFLHVRSIIEDSKGRLWIGNNGIGVLLVDGNEWVHFSKEHGLIGENSTFSGAHSPPGTLEHVFAICEDAQGNIWFGDRDTGVWRFDGQNFTNFHKSHGLPDAMAWQIYPSKSGKLWFAMSDGSVQQFNGETFERIF